MRQCDYMIILPTVTTHYKARQPQHCSHERHLSINECVVVDRDGRVKITLLPCLSMTGLQPWYIPQQPIVIDVFFMYTVNQRNQTTVIQQLFWAAESWMAVCFSPFFFTRCLLKMNRMTNSLCYLARWTMNGLVPARLPHSLSQCVGLYALV